MRFSEVKNQVSQLIEKRDSTAGSYLSVSRQMPKSDKSLPFWVKKINVAFLSNFTLQGLPEVFKTQATFHNLWVNTYLAPYNQYDLEILDSESKFNKDVNPHVVYLLVDPESPEFEKIDGPIDNLIVTTSAHIVTFESELTKKRYQNHKRVSLIGLGDFLKKEGRRKKYWNTKYRELGDFRLAPDAFADFSNVLMRYTIDAAGARKKCLVLDLDNTLWEGIVGEDGIDGISLKKDVHDFALNCYKKEGVALAINSRNNENDAWGVFDNKEEIKLARNHFAATRINWQDKATNMKEIAAEINMGVDSLVFVDDDPFQKNLIRESLPAVTVLDPKNIHDYQGFKAISFTVEDLRRGKMYTEEGQRKKLKKSIESLDDFLNSLNLRVEIRGIREPVKRSLIPRISQLTKRTNQFNLTTRRYSEKDINGFQKDNWKIISISATDRFGDYGTIGVAMVEPKEEEWRIDNFLLSCRILGRGVENRLLFTILKHAKENGASRVVGEFIPTVKNKPAKSFYLDSGFKLVDGVYEHDLKKMPNNPSHIK